MSLFTVGVVTALLPNLYGTLFALVWKSKVPDLSALSSRQRSPTQSIMSYRRSLRGNVRRVAAWSLMVLLCCVCLVGEYLIDGTHFCRHVVGGRYVYCLVVIFSGCALLKCIQLISDWEFAWRQERLGMRLPLRLGAWHARQAADGPKFPRAERALDADGRDVPDLRAMRGGGSLRGLYLSAETIQGR